MATITNALVSCDTASLQAIGETVSSIDRFRQFIRNQESIHTSINGFPEINLNIVVNGESQWWKVVWRCGPSAPNIFRLVKWTTVNGDHDQYAMGAFKMNGIWELNSRITITPLSV